MAKYLVLRQVNDNYFKLGVKLRPSKNRLTNKIYDEENAYQFGITLDSSYLLLPNSLIDVSDPLTMWWLELAKKQGIVVDTKEEAGDKPNCAFYVFDEDIYNETSVKDVETKVEAMVRLRELSTTAKADLCKLLGIDVRNMTATAVANTLYQIADAPLTKTAKHTYKTLLRLLDDENYKEKLLLADCIFERIIKVVNGQYYYNDILIGIGEADTIEWIKNDTNEEVVNRWKMELYRTSAEVISNSKTTAKTIKPKI